MENRFPGFQFYILNIASEEFNILFGHAGNHRKQRITFALFHLDGMTGRPDGPELF